jgi:hypothetical protein
LPTAHATRHPVIENVLESEWNSMAVVRDLAVGVVIGEHDVVPAAQLYGARQVVERRHRGRGVVGIVEVDEPRPIEPLRRQVFQLHQESLLAHQRHELGLRVGQQRAPDVGRVAGVGHDADVTGIEHRESQVREALLGAEQRDQLRRGIERHPEAPLHEARRRLAELGQADLERIATHRRIAHRGAQRLHRLWRRRKVSVARAQVDHVHALGQEPTLDDRELVDRVARQPLQPLAPPRHAGAPIPWRAKNSSAAPRTVSHGPITRSAGGSVASNISP